MKHEDVVAFLNARVDYERAGMPRGADLRLERTALLLEAIGSPHREYPIVHVAGTKGKGSTAHLIAALLQSAGKRVGLHTSPHFDRLEERFRVDGVPAEPDETVDLVETLLPAVEALDARLAGAQPKLTFFEITTALTFLHFARRGVDWAVVEVGMGGRLDATNVVLPEVAVITTISKDHTRQLGDRLESIAAEKAGIVKAGRPVVSGVTAPGPGQVIRDVCRDRLAKLRQLDHDFEYRYRSRGLDGGAVAVQTWSRLWPEVDLAMLGEHQAMNAAVALATIDALRESGHRLESIDPTELARVRVPGRVELVQRDPLVVIDVAHNVASAIALANALKGIVAAASVPVRPRTLIFGSARDKDWRSMLGVLAPLFDRIVLSSSRHGPRAMRAGEIAEELNLHPVSVRLADDPSAAWRAALDTGASARCKPGMDFLTDSVKMICVSGSFHLTAQIRQWIRNSAVVVG